MKTTRHFVLYLAHFFLELEIFKTKVVGEIKTRFSLLNTFFLIVPFVR